MNSESIDANLYKAFYVPWYKARRELERAKLAIKKEIQENAKPKQPTLCLKIERKNVNIEKDKKEISANSKLKDPRCLKNEHKNVNIEKNKKEISENSKIKDPRLRIKKELKNGKVEKHRGS